MLATELQHAIAAIHAAPHKLVLEFTGAGSLALWWLHSVAGSSRTILEAGDRYAAASLHDLLGEEPATFVSVDTAIAMARRAYARARLLSDASEPLLGVGCTATIATDRIKRGEHRCAIAVQHAHGGRAYAVTLAKGQRDRLGEETLVSQLLLRAIIRACKPELPAPLDLINDEQVTEYEFPASE